MIRGMTPGSGGGLSPGMQRRTVFYRRKPLMGEKKSGIRGRGNLATRGRQRLTFEASGGKMGGPWPERRK